MRGTPSAFQNLTNKNADTLYFISENGAEIGELYLGSKKIICDNNVSLPTALAQLTDVKLPTPVLDGQVLVYHIDPATGDQYWTAGNLEDLLADAEFASNMAVYEVVTNADESHTAAIDRILGAGTTLHDGDIVIVKDLIVEGKYQLTSYVYYNNMWVAMDGNYNAENVYFDQDLITTHAIGNITLTNGQGEIKAQGKNLKQVFDAIFVKEQNPSKTDPYVTTTLNKAGSYEIGNVVDGSWSASFNYGKYTYGPSPTGVEITSWSVTDSNGAAPVNATSGDFGDVTVVDGINYTVTATANHTAGATPKTNLGNDCTDTSKKIAEGSKKKTSSAITGYRAFFYGMSDVAKEDFNLDSATIRGLTNGGNYNEAKTLTFTAADLDGVKRFIVAIPDSSTRSGITSAKITSSQNADALSNYKLQTDKPEVYGINENTTKVPYRVWIYEPASIADVEVHEVKLG